jgi:hypothetical protein
LGVVGLLLRVGFGGVVRGNANKGHEMTDIERVICALKEVVSEPHWYDVDCIDEGYRAALRLEEVKPVAWLHPDKTIDVVVPTSLAWFDKPIALYALPEVQDEPTQIKKIEPSKPYEEVRVTSILTWRWVREGDEYVMRIGEKTLAAHKAHIEATLNEVKDERTT